MGRFTQGKLWKDEFDKWWWYDRHDEDGWQYIQNGSCVVNGEGEPCMWHGIMFEYHTDADELVLDCVVRWDKPVSPVNPREIVSEHTTEGFFTLTLLGSETLFRHMQYMSEPSIEPDVTSSHTECTVHGRWPRRTVLKFDTIIRFGPPSAQSL